MRYRFFSTQLTSYPTLCYLSHLYPRYHKVSFPLQKYIDNPSPNFNGDFNYEKYKREYYKTMANIQIKNRTAKNLNLKFIDFSATPLQGNLEAHFFICSAFYPSAPAFYPSELDAESIPD